MSRSIGYISILVLLMVGLLSCNRDGVYDGKMPEISTSLDTLRFDTVFTSIGSATREFKVFNRENKDINVSVAFRDQTQSFFRLNIDGRAVNNAEEVKIGANDSIYIFADVTIDPDQPLSISPFVVEEYLTITSKESSRNVLFEAYGQNANYIPSIKKKGVSSLISCDLGSITFDDPKPYVIHGVLYIDSCEVIIPQGTDIHVHGGVVTTKDFSYNDGIIYVFKNGKITANGTAEEPITIQGDRLEESYQIRPGQWAGMIFSAESRGNKLSHVKLKNSIIGYRVDSLASLSMDACEISHTAGQGLIGYHAEIDAVNCLIHNNGAEAAAMIYGGNYRFTHTTMGSFGDGSPALTLSNFYCFDPNDCESTIQVNPLKIDIVNSIIVGNEDDELSIADATEGQEGYMDYHFENTIVKVRKLIDDVDKDFLINDCINCLNYELSDTLFKEYVTGDFRLDTLSIAKDIGKFLPEVDLDISGMIRDDQPDAGCYEYYDE